MALKRLEILGNYNVAGRVLLLPISGNGDINITLGNCPSDGTDGIGARAGIDIIVATSTTQFWCTHIPTKSLSALARRSTS